MLDKRILEYVDDIISKVSASKEFKMKLENELIRHFIEASENTSIDEITNKLGSPKLIADRMSRVLIPDISKELNKIFNEFSKENMQLSKIQDRTYQEPNCNHHKISGEYMFEESNANIKLLYIPLIQICSKTERVRFPYIDERFFK